MSGRLFSRQRIRGVTFRHGRSSAGAGRSKDSGTSGPQAIGSVLGKKNSSTSAENIRNSAPPPLLERDLHRLLGDYGRNELHTLVSEAVDQLVQLKQLNQSFQRLMPDSAPDRKFLNTDESEELLADPLLETGVELVRVQRLWKHRLDMLEMIATAQDSLRNFSAKSAKTRPPPEAGSARRQK
jgi:hypothetical protein